jgi:hypothetical protein
VSGVKSAVEQIGKSTADDECKRHRGNLGLDACRKSNAEKKSRNRQQHRYQRMAAHGIETKSRIGCWHERQQTAGVDGSMEVLLYQLLTPQVDSDDQGRYRR